MPVSAIKVTLGTNLGDGKFNYSISYSPDPVANAATTVADFATAFTALDAAADAIVAITGDTYSHTTHQFTFGGSTGLTHAQWATDGALLNTAIADFILAQTAAAATNTSLSGNLLLLVDTAVLTTSNAVKWAAKAALQAAKNLGIVSP